MHPLVSPTLPFNTTEDCSVSSTFCSSLDPCSSHGISSLQSPSAFASFFSTESNQQIEALQPLGLDSADQCCGHHLRPCCGVQSLDNKRDDSASPSSLHGLASEAESLIHPIDAQKFVCSFHSSPVKSPNPNCEALQNEDDLRCISNGRLLQKTTSAENSIVLSSYLSLSEHDTEFSAFSQIQKEESGKEKPTFSHTQKGETGKEIPAVHFPSPSRREPSVLPIMLDSYGVCSKNSLVFHSQISDAGHFQSPEACSKNCMEICSASVNFVSLKTVPSEFRSSFHNASMPSTIEGDADNKILTKVHVDGIRIRSLEQLNCGDPPSSVSSQYDHIRKIKREALHEVQECQKTMYSPCKGVSVNVDGVDAASKENRSPLELKKTRKEAKGERTDSGGWMCPKDTKRRFKPKPRQLVLDKWLIRQR